MVNHPSGPNSNPNDLVPSSEPARNYATFTHFHSRERVRLGNVAGCIVGCFVNRLTGEVMLCPCGSWRCDRCGRRNVGRFLKRIRGRTYSRMATITLEGDGRPSRENLRRLNAGWRTWKRWLDRTVGRKVAFTWVNEQGEKSGRLHKHVLLDIPRFDYRHARAAAVRNRLGRVIDFQKVRNFGAQSYVVKYLSKGLGVEWPKYTRRCQTTEPRPQSQEGWEFYKHDRPSGKVSAADNWRDEINERWLNDLIESASLDDQRKSASGVPP